MRTSVDSCYVHDEIAVSVCDYSAWQGYVFHKQFEMQMQVTTK